MSTFSNGSDDNFWDFILGLESIINKLRLSSYEKLIYLREHLSRNLRTLLDSFNIEGQPYEAPKDLLSEAFDCSNTNVYSEPVPVCIIPEVYMPYVTLSREPLVSFDVTPSCVTVSFAPVYVMLLLHVEL